MFRNIGILLAIAMLPSGAALAQSPVPNLKWDHDDGNISVWKATGSTCVTVDTPAPYGGSTSQQVNMKAGDFLRIEIGRQSMRPCN